MVSLDQKQTFLNRKELVYKVQRDELMKINCCTQEQTSFFCSMVKAENSVFLI